MVICRLSNDASLVADGSRFWVVNDQGSVFRFERYNGKHRLIPTVTDMVNLREGVVHALCQDGSVLQITSRDQTVQDFQIQVVERL